MTPSKMREKLLELAKWHDEESTSGYSAPETEAWHKEHATLLRQVVETMEEGWVSVEATRLLAVREQLVKDDKSEAYHQLYMAAHESAGNMLQPWNEWEEAMLASRPKEKEE